MTSGRQVKTKRGQTSICYSLYNGWIWASYRGPDPVDGAAVHDGHHPCEAWQLLYASDAISNSHTKAFENPLYDAFEIRNLIQGERGEVTQTTTCYPVPVLLFLLPDHRHHLDPIRRLCELNECDLCPCSSPLTRPVDKQSHRNQRRLF